MTGALVLPFPPPTTARLFITVNLPPLLLRNNNIRSTIIKSSTSVSSSFICFDGRSGGFAPLQSTSLHSKRDKEEDHKWDPEQYDALVKGGDQVTSVLQDMIALLEDMEMDENSEAAAVELVAQGVIGKRVDEMESGFMMALDYMIRLADKDQDDQVS